MLKRTLAIFTLTICGFMNLQAEEAIPPSSNPIEINLEQDEVQQDNLLAAKKKKNKREHSSSSSESSRLIACCKKKPKKRHIAENSEETFAGCKKCKDRNIA